ncbi:MAG: ATP-dependent Clp protease adaptor ClpS [Clostridiales bacterium]|jgi:ATP-dependent Clp protease adaptor protein ClpS|nr:ATP-dependent Clp protease adaptor ClpS [Clostridiales bacterium]
MSTEYIEPVDNKVTVLPPKKYAAVFHNDDITPLAFVVKILENVFDKTPGEVNNIIAAVHKNGSCAAGVYTYDIAMTKKIQTDKLSKINKYPLKITVREAEG